MNEVIKMRCPSCGAPISGKKNDQDYICDFCGTIYQVKQTNQGVSPTPDNKYGNQLKSGIDRTGSEMTIKRLKEEIQELQGRLLPLTPEYEKLKNEVENPGIPLKFLRFWWIGIIVSIIMFITAIVNDIMNLALVAIAVFMFVILMYALAAKKAIKVKMVTKRYKELTLEVVQLRTTIANKISLLKRHRDSVDKN